MPLFRKVQLKFFGIITSILLAIFIAVLGSVNIIMDTVMEHQTRIVLEQVAAGVEYDGDTGRFFIERPDDENWQRFEGFPRTEIPSKHDSDNDGSPVTSAETTSAGSATSTAATTAQTTVGTTAVQQQTTAARETQAPQQTTRPPETAATAPPATTGVVTAPTAPNNGEGGKEDPRHTQTPSEPDKRDDDEDDKNKNRGGGQPFWGPWGPWTPQPWWNYGGAVHMMSDISFVPVLDGYTIINNNGADAVTSAVTTTAARNTGSRIPRSDGGDSGSVPRSLGSIDFFIIMADEDGQFLGIHNNDDMSEEVAQQYINEILGQKASTGMANNYQFCTEKKSNGTLMVFTDKSAEIDMMKKLKRTTMIVGLISFVILSAAAYFLSGIIVRPIRQAFDKQKQFISDASHELKTPLTVISANSDVLADEIGENKWLTYIRDQADRMNVLVNDLLNLTRLENNSDFPVAEFDLSNAIASTALPFECRAFESGKNFVLNIEEGVRITGSEQHIKQMAAIFIDNALKYSKEHGTVRVSLTSDGGKVRFSVYNTGTGLKESEKDKIFERFFRSDLSRNRATGGYGLGLAIAKSIIDRHKFRLYVDNAEGKSVCFIVTMS